MKKFSPTRTITKANIEKVPSDKPGVYRIKDAGFLVNYGFALLERRGGFNALIGKRKNRYGYDNAINDLFFCNL